MNVSGTKQRILDAAERLFAEHGYEGASLRNITAAASVNLAAVNYHFSSKEALIQAVFARKLGPLNRQRLAMLDAMEAEAGVASLPLERLVRAFLEPALRLLGQPESGSVSFGMLLGRMYSSPTAAIQRVFIAEMGEVVNRFSAAFGRALPHLPPAEVFWRVFFGIGAMAHTLAAPRGILKTLSGGLADPTDVQAAIERLTTFMVTGLRAPLLPDQRGGTDKRRGRKSRLDHGVNPHIGTKGGSPGAPRR